MSLGNWNRAGVKRRIGEILTHALADFDHGDGREVADVPIVYTWDPAQAYPSSAFLGLLDGSAETVGMRRTDHVSIDTFTVHCGVALVGFRDGAAAEEAAESALRAFDAVLRGCNRLIHPDVPAESTGSFHGVTTAVIGQVTGPYHAVDQAGSGTISGHVEFYVDCTTTVQR